MPWGQKFWEEKLCGLSPPVLISITYSFSSNQSCAGGDRTTRGCHHPLHVPLFWTLGRTLAGRQHSRVGPAAEIYHWCVAYPRGLRWWGGEMGSLLQDPLRSGEEACLGGVSDAAAVLMAGMMEFSLFGISYVSAFASLLTPKKVETSFRNHQQAYFLSSCFRQERISVGSLTMLNMRCVFAGCNWGPFTPFPGTTTPSGHG